MSSNSVRKRKSTNPKRRIKATKKKVSPPSSETEVKEDARQLSTAESTVEVPLPKLWKKKVTPMFRATSHIYKSIKKLPWQKQRKAFYDRSRKALIPSGLLKGGTSPKYFLIHHRADPALNKRISEGVLTLLPSLWRGESEVTFSQLKKISTVKTVHIYPDRLRICGTSRTTEPVSGPV